MKLKIFMLIFISILEIKSMAQQGGILYPQIGEKLEDHTFTDLVNYPERTLKISDFRGKWLVIDFWSRSCSGCIASFPKINQLDQSFKGKAKILMVGMYENNNRGLIKEEVYIKKLFSDRAKRQNLKFTNAYDTVALTKYDIWGLPAIFVINPEGTLVAKAGQIDSTTLAEIIAGHSPDYLPRYSRHEIPPKKYDYALPLLTNGRKSNGGIDTAFIGRSLLTRWTENMPQYHLSGLVEPSDKNGFEAIGFNLAELYRIAFTGEPIWFFNDSLYGKISSKVIVETVQAKAVNFVNSDLLAYQSTLLKNRASPTQIKNQLKDDLDRYLGFKSRIESRDVDVINLVVSDQKKAERLKTKGGKRLTQLLPDRPGTIIKNLPFNEFLKFSRITGAYKHLGISYDEIPVVRDKTGIVYNIDMVFDGDPSDLSQVMEVLHKHGLDLVNGKEKMSCIIVSEE
ncbi:TlpA family protein disulfide reductase [Pedobacter sp. PWIIR3]